MVGYVLSQLKPSDLYILSCGLGLGLSTAKNVELLGLYHYTEINSLQFGFGTEGTTSRFALMYRQSDILRLSSYRVFRRVGWVP